MSMERGEHHQDQSPEGVPFERADDLFERMEDVESIVSEAISQMEPHEVLNLCKRVELLRDRDRTMDVLTSYLDVALLRLAEDDFPRFRDICTALAEDGSSKDNRDRTIELMPVLTRHDHELGFRLQHQLVRDSDENIREAAFSSIRDSLPYREDDGLTDSIPHLAERGLTISDAMALEQAFANAEAGINIYDPDAAALDKLIEAIRQDRPSPEQPE